MNAYPALTNTTVPFKIVNSAGLFLALGLYLMMYASDGLKSCLRVSENTLSESENCSFINSTPP